MMKKRMILADSDSLYLNNLANYFMEKAPQIELGTFSRADKLKEHLDSGNKADILAVDENMINEIDLTGYPDVMKIVLSLSMTSVPGCEIVKKYQKTENLMNEILLKYAEASGASEIIKGKNQTKAAAFYSPAGGTGKTTLALALATAAAKAGQRVFYLNLEGIDSVRELLGPTPGSMTDVLLAMKTKGMRADIKLAASAAKEPRGGFYYLSGVESISEYEEISGEEIRKLVETVCGLAEYDLLILDLDAGFGSKTKEILESADVIFTPVLLQEASMAKLRRFLRESEMHDMYRKIQDKVTLIMNQVDPKSADLEQKNELLRQIPCCAMIAASKAFEDWDQVIQAGSSMLQVMQPLLQKMDEC